MRLLGCLVYRRENGGDEIRLKGLATLERLLPGIEPANGDCADLLPRLPPADLILPSPPDVNLRKYGGYNGTFDFDAVAAACIANLAPGDVPVWVIGDKRRAIATELYRIRF